MPNRRSRHPQGHRKQNVVALVPNSGMERPPAPKGLLKKSKERWDGFWDSDVSQAVQSSDLYALTRWIQATDERDRFHRAVKKEPTVTGSQGQPVLNPLAKRLADLELQIARFEVQFGMTPKARADLGVSAGDAAMTAERLNRMVADARDEDEGDDGAIDGSVVEEVEV
jgi:P27 family predicted phage terminase small subunit